MGNTPSRWSDTRLNHLCGRSSCDGAGGWRVDSSHPGLESFTCSGFNLWTLQSSHYAQDHRLVGDTSKTLEQQTLVSFFPPQQQSANYESPKHFADCESYLIRLQILTVAMETWPNQKSSTCSTPECTFFFFLFTVVWELAFQFPRRGFSVAHYFGTFRCRKEKKTPKTNQGSADMKYTKGPLPNPSFVCAWKCAAKTQTKKKK